MGAVIVVFLGAGIGGVLRHLMNVFGGRLLGYPSFPFVTLAVNVSGSFVMGLVAGWFMTRWGEGLSQEVRLFITTGMIGGYTTFSTFSLEFAVLVERGAIAQAVVYVAGSLVLGFAALFAGLMLMRSLA